MKRYVFFLCMWWAALGVGAQQFTTFDWQAMRIDSVLPVYTEVIPLETDYRMYNYQVTVDYPQYAPLKGHELEVATRHAAEIGESLQIDTHVGVQRGEGMIDVSFVPIVVRDGRFMKLLSGKVNITAIPKPGRVKTATRAKVASQSVLAEGRWVKISITEDGIYQLTRQSLQKMGFKNPERVHLYGYGGHRIAEDLSDTYDDLEEVPLYYNAAQDNWLFWGNGLVHWKGSTRVFNPYATKACYFLTEGEEASGIEEEAPCTGTPVASYDRFRHHVLYEKDEYAWFSAGCNLYDSQNFSSGGSRTYKLTTPGYDANGDLTIAFTASAETKTTLTSSVNGQPLPDLTLAATSKYTYATRVTSTLSVIGYGGEDENWQVKLSSTAGNDARLDYLALHYDRRLELTENGFLAFNLSYLTRDGLSRFQLKAPDRAKVMRIGSPGRPATLMPLTHEEDWTLSFTTEEPMQNFVCFDPDYTQFPQPQLVGEVECQNLHALDSLDMVIIVPASGKLTAEAQRLADAHAQYDGLRTAVVRADQVYNEFSSGTPDATAYRRLMKMLYDKVADKACAPRYLLLMGDCAWDNRMLSSAWRSATPDDYLLCYESDNSMSDTESYVMEDYFGLLDDGEGADLLRDKPDLGVGRFPVTTVAQARVMVDKCIRFMSRQNAGAWKNIYCMLGDDGDNNEHMVYADSVCRRVEVQTPQVEVRKVMWDAYTRVSSNKSNTYPDVEALMKEQMEKGALVINYMGHANASSLSHEYVLELEDFANNQSDNLPLWVTAACDVMPFDGSVDNIGEAAVLNPQGGALAFYGTTRTVYAIENLRMNLFFMRYLFGRDANGRRHAIGDAIRLAKNAIIIEGKEGSLKQNKLQYALLGDPALVMGVPARQVVVDSINGCPVAEDVVQLAAGTRVTVCGHLTTEEGLADDSFQGTVSMRVFDTQTQVTCFNNAGADKNFTFLDRGNPIYHALDSVQGGRFRMQFTVPVDISYSPGTARMVFYALSEQKDEASGYCESFSLDGTGMQLDADTLGPEIVAYLNEESFTDGDVVNAQPYFVARLKDDSGINASGIGLGHDLTLCVDGRADLTFNLNDYYTGDFGDATSGTVAYTLPHLDNGPHSLSFRAWDVLNNTSSCTFQFVVDGALKPSLLQVTASQNPAVEQTSFLVSYDRPGATCRFTLTVYDFAGRQLWRHESTGSSASGLYSIPWNLCTSAGGRLGSGIYFYRCTLQSDESKAVSKTQKIVVLNNK